MKKVLVITYAFPPHAGNTAQRKVGLAKHFKNLGLETIVLTVKKNLFEKLDCERTDYSLLNDLKELKIERTSSFMPIHLINIMQKLRLSFLFKVVFPLEAQIFWTLPAFFRGLRIIREEKPDFILSMSLPNTPHFIGYLLKKSTNTPWIADFADPMSYGLHQVWFTRIAYWGICFFEKLFCRNADGLSVISPEAKRIMLERYDFLEEAKIHVTTNAYDDQIQLLDTTPTKNNKFNIVHSGSFSRFYYGKDTDSSYLKRLAYKLNDLFTYRPFKADLKPASIEPLLIAVKELLILYPKLKSRIHITLNGFIHDVEISLIEKHCLSNIIKITGLTSYKESLKIINSADLLYFPNYIDIKRKRNFCYTGKIFPYIASLKPILAPIQKGDAADLLTKSGLGLIVNPYDIKGMTRAIYNVISSKIKLNPNVKYIKGYSRYSQTKSLLEFAQRIIAK